MACKSSLKGSDAILSLALLWQGHLSTGSVHTQSVYFCDLLQKEKRGRQGKFC